ncbi:MAG: FecR domain-containing protein [Alphaproteobacteria bacterium]|nr:FecR domain-containing protein [Alphaproteobacteria bacterium SS10]
MTERLGLTRRHFAAGLASLGFSGLGLAGPAYASALGPRLGAPVARVVTRRSPIKAEHPALDRRLQKDASIYLRDRISTGKGGYCELELVAGGVVRIGPNTTVLIDKFVGDIRFPKTVHLKVEAAGGVRYLPDPTPKLPPGFEPFRLSLETPLGTINGRASDLWVGRLDGSYTVYVNKGAAEVVNFAGSQTIDQSGLGIKLRDQAAAPPLPVPFRDRQLERIAASVAVPTGLEF